MCDSRFFPGLVALVNSLRLVGHDEPIFVQDTGLTHGQRAALGDEVILLPTMRGEASVLMAPVGPSSHPAEVRVLIDADMIVTRPLTELVDAARGGRIVAVADDPPIRERFFGEWEQLLDLPRLRRRPYVNAGLLCLPAALGRLLPLWSDAQTKMDLKATRYGKGHLEDPLYFADQDVLNAVLAAHFDPAEMVILDHRLAPYPPFPGVRLIDEKRLVCRHDDGVQPFVLHHILAKPWLKATRNNIYAQLLPRLLLAPDVAIRLEPHNLPLRLRPNRIGQLDRQRAAVQAALLAESRRQLGRFGIRTRLRSWRRSRSRR